MSFNMKNKFLAIAALGAAALGSAVLSAPANAQIAQGSGPTSVIPINVIVPEILYLRTIESYDLTITPTQLVGATGAGLLSGTPVTGSNPPAYINAAQDQSESPVDSVNTASPFTAPGAPVAVSIPNAYIVWSNSPTGSYSVGFTAGTFTAASSGSATLTVAPTNATVTQTTEGLINATAKPLDLNVTLDGTSKAGSYAGTVTVEAFRPN
jgi:hypothetical protein